MFDRKTTTAKRLMFAKVVSRAVALGCSTVALQAIVFRGRGLDVTIGMMGLAVGAFCIHYAVRSINRRNDPRHRQLPRDLPEETDPFRMV
jgi:hypothetical protein